MSVISAHEALLSAMYRGIGPTIPEIEEFIEEVNDFMLLVDDYEEWDANKETWRKREDGGAPTLWDEPAITVKKLRRMLGYGEVE